MRKSARLIHYSEKSASIIVLFREAGAAAFFREPLHELFGQSVSLDHFICRFNVSIIEEQLAEAKNDSQRVAIIDKLFLSRLQEHKPDKLITAVTERIDSANGLLKMKALADAFYVSQDVLEKRFRKSIGTSPKQFASLIRMQWIIRQQSKENGLAELAFETGYYDQAHFNKNFKLFTGLTPTEFRSASFW